MALIAGFNEPVAVAVRAAANDADVVRPDHDRANLWAAGTRSDAGPVARQIEPRIGNAEHATHIGAAPGAAVAGVMPAVKRSLVNRRLGGVMMVRGQSRRVQTRQCHRRDKQTTHTDLRS